MSDGRTPCISLTQYKPGAFLWSLSTSSTYLQQNTAVSSGQWHVNSSNYNRNKGLQKTHGLATEVTKNTTPNFNDRVAVKRTVVLLRNQKYSKMVNSMAVRTLRWPGHIERMILVSRKISNGRMLRKKLGGCCLGVAVSLLLQTRKWEAAARNSLLLYIFRATLLHM